MRSGDFDSSPGLGNPKELSDKGHYIGHVLGDMATDDFVELIIRKRVRKDAQIVNHIRVSPGVCVDANGARRFVPTAPDVENSFPNRRPNRGRRRAFILAWPVHF
jgi:hypothetical protein